jgi:hypothetical protein
MFIFTLLVLALFIFYWNFQLRSSEAGQMDSVTKFDVDQSLIKILLNPDETVSRSIRIKNVWGNDLNFKLEPSENLIPIVSFDKDEFTLASGAIETINIDFVSDRSTTDPDVYAGKINIVSSQSDIVPVIIEIESEYVFFDLNLNLETLQELNPGDDVEFTIKLFNLQGFDPTSVKMEYSLRDLHGNEMMTESESVVVSTQTTFTKMINLGSDLPIGDYVFSAKAKYGQSVGTSSYLFHISKYSSSVGSSAFESCITNNFCLFGVLSVFLVISVMVILVYTVSLLRPHESEYERQSRETDYIKQLKTRLYGAVPRPRVKVPVVKAPIILPSARPFRFSLPKLPRVKMPRIKVPRLKLPKLRLPRIRAPKLPMPKMFRPKRAKHHIVKFKGKINSSLPSLPVANPFRFKLPSLPRIRAPKLPMPKMFRPKRAKHHIVKFKGKINSSLPSLPVANPFRFKLPKLPRIKIPNPPRIKAPRLPRLKLPRLQLPRLKLPRLRLPRLKLSRAKLPTVSESKKVKQISMKAARMKKKFENLPVLPTANPFRFTMPKLNLSMPKLKGPSLPKFRLPRIRAPKINGPSLPKFRLPRIRAPKINGPSLPTLKLPSIGVRKTAKNLKKRIDKLLKL